jgi:monoterpene epsilon-lactone hydrolase
MPSKEFKNLFQLLKSFQTTDKLTLFERRSDFEERSKILPIAEGIALNSCQIRDLNAEWVIPKGASDDSIILYLHGGGYCVGSINTHRSMASFIAKASKTKMLLIDYRLAPEHPFPAAIEDATMAYKWLLSQGHSPDKIVIAGDSAGGGITISTLLYLRKNKEPMPACAVCMSPWVDMELAGKSQKTKADLDIIIQIEVLKEMVEAYVGDADPKEPLVSPIHADLTGLPPILIQVGTSEVLLDDAKRLAENAKKSGVDVTLDVWENMIHIFQYFCFMLPEGQEAIDKVADFIEENIR